jgi:hypothetical protein
MNFSLSSFFVIYLSYSLLIVPKMLTQSELIDTSCSHRVCFDCGLASRRITCAAEVTRLPCSSRWNGSGKCCDLDVFRPFSVANVLFIYFSYLSLCGSL